MACLFGSKVSPTQIKDGDKSSGYGGDPSPPDKTKSVSSDGKLEKQSPLTQDKDMKDMITFITQNFKQKECCRFVPVPNQKVKTTIELKCHCGEVLTGHGFDRLMKNRNMSSPKSQEQKLIDFIPDIQQHFIPNELQEMMAKVNWNKPPPLNLPTLHNQWDKDKDICTQPTCTFGEINFVNVEHIVGTKPAKYIRLSNEDSVDNAVKLMEKYWQIKKPKPPNLVISVVGGAKNFKLDGGMRDTFNNGLIRAAKTTNAWLITSGFNMGVMKSVGQAVQQGQSFSWEDGRMTHLLRCIGIAPWGYVKDRCSLERDTDDTDDKGKFPVHLKASNMIEHDRPAPLNPDHTHFIFVDDGIRNKYMGSSAFRAKLEREITAPKNDKDPGIPLVLVVVEGGLNAIIDACTSLKHDIPVVICSGTGRAADIIAYAYSHTKTVKKNKRDMKKNHELKLKDKICEAYGMNWKSSKVESTLKKVKECCKKAELITIFHMNKNEDLDHAILSALLKARSSNTNMTKSQKRNLLLLALTWNRVDIAQEEIFREDVFWPTKELKHAMTRAILEDKVQFVRLLIQQGVFMKEYLTEKRLNKLYKKIPEHSHILKMLKRLMNKDSLSYDEKTLHKFLKKLLGEYNVAMEYDETSMVEESQFKRPYKELFLWAILNQRQTLAKLCWEMGEEPVTTAIAATRIYGSLSKECNRHETDLKENLTAYKMEFEKLATSVLDACHSVDPDKAMILAERESPSWDSVTCMQMAASANDQKFLSTLACQNSIGTQWRKGILSSWKKVLCATLFPPLLFCLEIATDSKKQEKHTTEKVASKEIPSNQEKHVVCCEKLVTFFTSPICKFSYGAIMYVAFTLLFTYLILVDFTGNDITPIEIVCMVWILTYIVDDVHTFYCFPSLTLWGKIRDWYGVLKVLGLLNFILALVGFIIHIISPGSFMAVKAIYCVSCIIFYVRVMKVYIANATLGPKLIMIQRMLEELSLFIMVLLVFLLAYGVASQGLLYTRRKQDWVILKDIFYYPYWQLFGEIFLDETILTDDTCVRSYYHTTNITGGITPCRTSHWLVPILLAGYLLVGNVLLLNLLIAIFSHVFETVEKNSVEIWKYQMYFLSMEYKNKTFLVPPFSIISHIVLFFAWIIRRTRRKCTPKSKSKDDVHETCYLEYLQLFEKEMMANVLRNQKAMEMTSMEMRVSKLLQKRVDELAKHIEDEMIADQQDIHVKGEAKSAQNGEIKFKPASETDSEEERHARKHKEKERKKKKRKDKDKEKERRGKEEDLVAPDESNLNNVNVETSSSKKPKLTQKNVLD